MSHSANDPVTWTVEVSGLTTKGSRGMPDDEAVAVVLGDGLSVGTGVGAMQWGCIICLISPNTFTSSLKKKAGNLLELRVKPWSKRQEEECCKRCHIMYLQNFKDLIGRAPH